MTRLLLILLPILFSASAFSQQFTPYTPIVSVGSEELPFPWAGGLNKPQFSAVDFNEDGQDDLFVFDREGGAILVFLRSGSGAETTYTYAPGFAASFPELRDWALLRDFNQDGLMDIFTNAWDEAPQGIAVYRGVGTAGNMAFERIQFPFDFNILYAQQANGSMLNLYCSYEDLPAIDDIDNDGDLDILAFEPNGIYTYWYRNRSVEEGYGTDTLLYSLEDNCWGGYIEDNFTSGITLSTTPGECADGLAPPSVGSRHAGSTLLTLDLDGDSDRDLLLGDLSNKELILLTNGGSAGADWMNQEEQGFPAAGVPVSIPIFNAAFNPDVNGDGLFDVLVAPNAGGLAKDVENVWWYENAGTAEDPELTLVAKDFLVGDMIDLGTGAHPCIMDVNADGLPDLVVGNGVVYQEGGVVDPRLFLWLNTGTPEEPVFELADNDWLGMSQYGADNRYEFAPTFGDLDSDGDQDLLIGEFSGRFFYLENIAGTGQPLAFADPVFPFADLNILNAPVPQIIDLNKDGLPDIVAGSRFGFLNYFQNIGTPGNPAFGTDPSESPNILQLGGVDTRENSFTTRGYSAPAFYDLGDQWALFCGTYRKGLQRYTGIEDYLTDTFPITSDLTGLTPQGERLHPAVGDLNNDGTLEVIIGNRRGGLSLYTTNLNVDGSTPTTTPISPHSIRISPNPADSWVQIEATIPFSYGAVFQLYDPTGILCLSLPLDPGQRSAVLSLPNLPPGVYFWVAGSDAGHLGFGKLVVL